MKKIKLYFLGALLSLKILACKKLELYPHNAIELSQSFKTIADASTWNNGLYVRFRDTHSANYIYTQDVQADQLNASIGFSNWNTGGPHRWGDVFSPGETNYYYQFYYSAIAYVNTMLKGYEAIVPSNPEETEKMNKYKGDAFLARAYYYHQLILRYAKAYNPATAATDLGVPLILTYDISALPARANLKVCYDQILSDINSAKKLLAATPGTNGANKFTIDAALALEARVRLYMQDYSEAYTVANLLIIGGKYPLYQTKANYKSYWHDDQKQEDIMQVFVSKTEPILPNNIYLGLNVSAGVYTPDFIPTQTVLDSYENSDYRKKVFFEQKLVQIQGTKYPDIWLVNKYPGNPALFTSTSTNFQHAPKVFRIAEMYLIAAEAAAVTNPTNAITALNALRKARGLNPLTNIVGSALIQEIRNERTRELAFEGFRLWDLKRWGLGFNRGQAQNLNIINTGQNYNLINISANDPKFVWAIPPNDVDINSNIVQNPGW